MFLILLGKCYCCILPLINLPMHSFYFGKGTGLFKRKENKSLNCSSSEAFYSFFSSLVLNCGDRCIS